MSVGQVLLHAGQSVQNHVLPSQDFGWLVGIEDLDLIGGGIDNGQGPGRIAALFAGLLGFLASQEKSPVHRLAVFKRFIKCASEVGGQVVGDGGCPAHGQGYLGAYQALADAG